jgi:hypothetical protein
MAGEVESKVVITAQNNTGTAFSGIAGGLDGVIGKFGALAAALGGVAAVVGGAKWLSDITTKAIDAAGRIDDLSQATGVSGETLSRFSLAAKLGGTDLETMAGGLNKLNVKIDEAAGGGKEASAAFARLGVDIKDAGGEVRGTEDILGDLAEAFSGLDDGAAKTAAVIDIFGKSGTALIPFLNAGRDGLEEAAAAADKLGITLSSETIAAAAQTGDAMDLVGQVSVGLGNKIMAQVLPTILQLSTAFTDFVVRTGALDVAAQIVAGAFKVLVNAGQIVYGVFATLGNVIGGTASALKLFVEGEYSKAWDALKGGFSAAGTSIVNTGESISKVWSTTVGDVVKANAKAEPSLKKLSAAKKEVKAEADKAAEAMAKFFETIEDKIIEVENEIRVGQKATEVDKLRTKFLQDLERGQVKATEVERAAVMAMLDRLQAGNELIEADKRAVEYIKETGKANADRVESEYKAVAALGESIAKQREQNAEIGKSKAEIGELEIARLRDAQATLATKAAIIETIPGMEDMLQAIQDQIAGYDTLIALKRDGLAAQAMADAAEEAKKAAEESRKKWEETAASIETSLTDALLRGFESGKGFGQNLIATLKNMFNTLVLKPIIQAVVNPVAGGVTGLLGLTGTASAQTGATSGGSGLLGSLGSLGGLFGAGGLGGALTAGAGWLTGATSLTGALGAAGSLIGTGTLGGSLSGIAMGTGALAPFVLGALALSSIFGKKRGGPKLGGSFSTTGERLYTPDSADAEAAQLGQSALGSIAALAGELGGTSSGLSLGIGFDSDPQGTAGNRISSFLRDASGRDLFNNIAGRNVGRDDAALQSGLGDETAKLILAGLQASDLPSAVKDYLAGINVANFTASQLDAVIAAAKDLAPKVEQSLLDKALEDPGTYAAVSTEVRELVTLQQEHVAIAKEQRDAQLQAVEMMLAQLEQAKNAYQRMIEAMGQVSVNTARLVDQSVVAAAAPPVLRTA